MSGVCEGEVAAGGFAICEEDDATGGGRDEAGDVAEVFLDLGSVIFLIGATADEEGVDGRGEG
jgi:hypothetical protein